MLSDSYMYVLDVLRYDVEQVESIVRLLNDRSIGWVEFNERAFTEKDVVDKLMLLVESELVVVLYEEGGWLVECPGDFEGLKKSPNRFWYKMTEKGRAVYDEWEPPVNDGDSAGTS